MCHVCEAYGVFLAECNPIRTCFVYGDAFFNNIEFVAMNKEKHIRVSTCVAKMEHLTKHGGNKLGVVDRMTRTIKSHIQKHISTTGDPRWPTYLQNLIRMYNGTPHATLGGTTPNAAFEDFWKLQGIYRENKMYNDELREQVATMYVPGDQVRVLLEKPTFGKEGPNFSEQVYTVSHMEGNRFVLKNASDEDVPRRYTHRELLKCEGVQLGNLGAETLVHASQQGKIRRIVVHNEKIAKNVAAANKIIKKCRSKKPIASVVKDKLKRPQPKGKWYVVQQDNPCMRLRDRSKTAPTEWWKS